MPKARGPSHPADQVAEHALHTPRPSPVMRGCGLALAVALRLVPRQGRFRVTVRLAALLEPLIARTGAWKERSRLRTDTIRETTLEIALMMLTRHGTTFDPVLRIEGADALPPPSESVLIVGPHTMLSRLFVRYLEDAGYRPTVIEVVPHFTPGSRTRERVLHPSTSLLLKVRKLLRENGTVAAMIDRDGPELRSRAVRYGGTQVFVSEALLQVALRAGARIVFIATTLTDRREVLVRLEGVPPRIDRVSDVVDRFVGFVALSLRREAPAAAELLPASHVSS